MDLITNRSTRNSKILQINKSNSFESIAQLFGYSCLVFRIEWCHGGDVIKMKINNWYHFEQSQLLLTGRLSINVHWLKCMLVQFQCTFVVHCTIVEVNIVCVLKLYMLYMSRLSQHAFQMIFDHSWRCLANGILTHHGRRLGLKKRIYAIWGENSNFLRLLAKNVVKNSLKIIFGFGGTCFQRLAFFYVSVFNCLKVLFHIMYYIVPIEALKCIYRRT